MNRKTLGLLFTLVFLSFAFLPLQDDPLTRIVQQLVNYQANRPTEKVFLHLDKPYYASGEDIWFKAYLVDGRHLQLDSSVSKVIYVELLTSENRIIERQMLYSPEGITNGDFHIPDSLPQGNYLIRAYTNYQRNFNEEFYFRKEIAIYNSDSKSLQPSNGNAALDLQFFPEGGNLIAGTESRVALKAINSSGKSVDVEGDIVDEQNNVIVSFASEHKGMGSFKITPIVGKKYSAKLRKPSQTSAVFPAVQEKGYSMQVVDAGSTFKVSIFTNTANPAPFNLVGQSRGEVMFAARGELKGSPVVASVPKNKFPSGIVHLTVFDGMGEPQAERLVFVNHDDNTRIKVVSDKTSYKKRGKVELHVQALNSKSEPLQGNFSVSVYDEALMPDVNSDEETIADYFLMTSDLAGKIEDPAYYLKDRSPQTMKNLDLVMMTHGWRRFTWKSVLHDELGPLGFYAETGIRLSGTVMKSVGQKPAANATLKIFNKKGDFTVVTADDKGRFYTEDMVYYDSMRLAIQTENEKGKQTTMKLNIDPFNESPLSGYSFSPMVDAAMEEFLKQAEYKANAERTYDEMIEAKTLQAVEITATKIETKRRPAIYGNPSATITSKDIKPSAINIFQAIQSKIPGATVRGAPPNMTIILRSGNAAPPLFVLDGTPVDLEVMNTINPADVEYVDILRGAAAAIYGSRALNGVMAVYTKRGENTSGPTIGIEKITYPGFYRAREFYSPKFDDPEEDPSKPDVRTTLYWNPSIETDDKGEATIGFFASNAQSKYRIIVQGMTYDGKPGATVGSFVVE